jgi:hypothetical protein
MVCCKIHYVSQIKGGTKMIAQVLTSQLVNVLTVIGICAPHIASFRLLSLLVDLVDAIGRLNGELGIGNDRVQATIEKLCHQREAITGVGFFATDLDVSPTERISFEASSQRLPDKNREHVEIRAHADQT